MNKISVVVLNSAASRRVRLLALSLVLTGCASTGGYSINLMPAPEVFADGIVNPLPVGQPPVSYDNFEVLYATDRKPADPPYESPFYVNREGYVLRLGRARVKSSEEGIGWEEARKISLASNRDAEYPLRVVSVTETGLLASTWTAITRPFPEAAGGDKVGRRFARDIDQRLSDSGVKDIYIFVHGYRVVFANPVLISAELWHFLGYRGAFVAYAWRATPRALAYASDSETAVANGRKFRLFLTYLAENTQAERIHVIAYSAGARMVLRALEQLALLNADASDEEIRRDVRIGTVAFVGGDTSRRSFGAGLADGIMRIPERMVIYVSTTDKALNFSQFIFRRPRLGQMWVDEVPPPVTKFLLENPSLEAVDVTGAAGSTLDNGHGYFRASPWVSSDLLTLLAYDLDPVQRGLVRETGSAIWTFPPDYIQRLRKSLLERDPSLATSALGGG